MINAVASPVSGVENPSWQAEAALRSLEINQISLQHQSLEQLAVRNGRGAAAFYERARNEQLTLTQATFNTPSSTVTLTRMAYSLTEVNQLMIDKAQEKLKGSVSQSSEIDAVLEKYGITSSAPSPESTADFIVGLARKFMPLYEQNHADMQGQELLDSYMGLIRPAIDQGFAEAREILDGLSILSGDLEAGVNQTYELVQEGLDSFYQERLSLLTERVEEAA